MTRTRTSLSIALLAAFGVSAPAFAQEMGEQLDAWHSAEQATESASDASAHAQSAQTAAAGANVVADQPATGTTADVAANVANDNATQAAVAATVATGAAVIAQDAAEDAALGRRENRYAADTAEHAAAVAESASAVAANAAADARMAHATGLVAAAEPPQVVVPAAPRSDRPAMVGNDNVTFSDHPGNSISPNYSVDFDAMDSNGDGVVTRAEGRGNPDLMREFHVVDLDNNGRLTRVEMKDWIDPLSQ